MNEPKIVFYFRKCVIIKDFTSDRFLLLAEMEILAEFEAGYPETYRQEDIFEL